MRPRESLSGTPSPHSARASTLNAEQSSPGAPSASFALPEYALAQNYRSLKQSSYDRTGGNGDRWPIEPGETHEVFAANGPASSPTSGSRLPRRAAHHLKEMVLRMYWDGNAKPSVETPVGDFFGLNLGQYFVYQSAFLNCSSVKALNCYFAMPFRQSARMTVTNEGAQRRGRVLFQHRLPVASRRCPSDALYFHAQYRQAAPNTAAPFAPATRRRSISTARTTTCSWKRAAAAT